MFKSLFLGILWPTLWLAILVYVPDEYEATTHLVLRWMSGTLMVAYLYTVPKFMFKYDLHKLVQMKIALRLWPVAALFAVIWGYIVTLEAALMFITAISCSTLLRIDPNERRIDS